MKSVATFTWESLKTASSGEAVSHHRHFDSVSIENDTRAFADADCSQLFYMPLVGKSFDGHDYIADAYHAGVAGAFVSKSYFEAHPDLARFPNLILVDNTLVTYLQLGRFHRRRTGACIVAITGSSGKTTTKDMMQLVLATQKTVQASPKNHNNEIGVAQTLLSIEDETDIMIVEMGMRASREIALLSIHAEPDVSVITNVGSAHIGLLGSHDAIAEAKTEIFEGMNTEAGIVVLNGDDPLLLRKSIQKWEGREETFSLHDVSKIHRLENGGVSFVYEDLTFYLGLPGQHNMMNALATIKVAECLNLRLKPILKTLQAYGGAEGRWEKQCLSESSRLYVINDAYNANPESLRASLVSFNEKPSSAQLAADADNKVEPLKKYVILGHMAELGAHELAAYERLVEWAVAHEPDYTMVFVGEKAKTFYDCAANTKLTSMYKDSIEDVVAWVLTDVQSNATFLLKGSREAGLDQFVPLLKAKLAPEHAVS